MIVKIKTKTMKEFIITEELANKLLQYLAQKPLGETLQLFTELRQLKPVEGTVEEPIKLEE